MKVEVIKFDGVVVGFVDLNDVIFGLELCVDILYCVVCWQCVKV